MDHHQYCVIDTVDRIPIDGTTIQKYYETRQLVNEG
jgi:hypothetical protein